MACLVLCKEDGLWAMLPERSGGNAYSLRRLDAATANSSEALAALAAATSGSACIIDLQRYEAAVARLTRGELAQAITGAVLLGSSGRLPTGLLPALQQCGEVVAGVPTLPAVVFTDSSTAFNSCSNGSGGSAGSSGSSGGASGNASPTIPTVFELAYLLCKHRVQGSASRLAIQSEADYEEHQLRRQMQQLAQPLQSPLAPPAAALAAGGAELWVRWADSTNEWCMLRQAPGERPCARCSCGSTGFGLLFCEHLASAYNVFVSAPAEATGSASSSGSGGAASSKVAPVALDVAALEAACAELTNQQLRALLLCTALYTGAGSVLLDGLGLEAADLRPLGGAGLAPEAAAFLAASKPSTPQVLQASGVHIGPYGLPAYTPLKDQTPGCSLGSWRAAVPAAAGPVGFGTVPLLQHAALQLAPPSAEGLWLAVGMSTGLTGLPLSRSGHVQASLQASGGLRLLQAGRLLFEAGHVEYSRHLLQEWVVALSLAPAWPANVDDWRPGLVALWRECMPAAVGVEWWMGQLAAPGSGSGPSTLGQQRQRLSAICSVDYIQLIEELLGPLAAAQLTFALLEGLSRACSRGAAHFATGQTKSGYIITDLRSPAGQAATLLASAEATGMGFACSREQLLRLLEICLNSKAPQHAAGQQPDRPASGGGRRKVKRRGQQGAAGGRGAAGAQQGQGPQLPLRSVGEAPTLLLSAARGMAEQLLALPLDQAMELFDGLVPDLEPIVLEEMAGLQVQQLRMLQTDVQSLLKEAQRGLPPRQPAAKEQAAAAAAAGPAAAAPAAAARAQQQAQQQAGIALQDLQPNQRTSVLDQMLNRLPAHMRVAYRHLPRNSLAEVPYFQQMFEAWRGQLRIPPPAGAGAAAAAAGAPAGQQAPPARGLLDLLEAAASPQPASSKRRLTYAACYCAEQLARKHGWAALQQLEAEGGAGWRHLVNLLEQAQPQYSRWSYDLLPAALAAVAYLFVDAKHTPSKSKQRKQRQGVGAQQAQQAQQGAAKVPAEVVAQLVSMLPGLLEACCEVAWEALHGHGGSSSSSGGSGGSGGVAGSPAGGADGAQPGGPAVAVHSSNRSVVADRDALALALSGITSCLKLASALYTADWPSCLSVHHTSTLSRLHRLMPGALVRAAAVLLETAMAADQAAAEIYIHLYMTVQHDWTVEAERAAAALLPLLPWTIPDAADASRPGTSAAAAGDTAASLLSVRPQVLAAAAALERVRFSSPVRRCSLALVCRCLQAAAVSQAVPAAERQQAADALLRLVLSPATAAELHTTELTQPDTHLLIECALGAAAAALQGGSSDGGLGGELAYLAVNLLAHSANFAQVPLLRADPPAAASGAAGRAEAASHAAKHSGWQLAALQVVEWWQGRAAAGEQLAGSPPPLFCASTLMALLLRAWEPSVQAAAVAALRRLAAADPLPLLACDSLTLLVHLAHKQMYSIHGSRQLQDAVDALLSSVRAAATAAGRAEQHMWPVWRQHPPAAASVPADPAKQVLDLIASAGASAKPADPWDRLTARMNVLQPVGRGGASGTAGRARGAAASAAAQGGGYPAGMGPSAAAALRDADMRSAAAELMGGYPFRATDIYGHSLSEEDEDYYEYEDYYDYYDEEGGLLGDLW